MADASTLATRFQGLLPAFDARQVDQPHLIDARNVFPQAAGARSYFGSKLLSTDLISTINDATHTDSFKVDDTVFYFDPDGVHHWNKTTSTFDKDFDISTEWSATEAKSWSTAFVANKYFFCNPNLGQRLIQYDTISQTWSYYLNSDLPPNIRAITQAIGRLIILGEDLYGWSSQDEPNDLDYTGNSGAGRQGLSKIGGKGIFIDEYGEGVLVYTTNGVMNATDIGNATLVFRHDIFDEEVKILNSFSHIDIDDAVQVIMTSRGLFVTSGETFNEFRPAFNQFLIEQIFPNFGTDLDTRLHYCPLEKAIYFSIRTIKGVELYDQCYVLSEALEQWGSFDRDHYQLLFIDNVNAAIESCTGYIDINGMLSPFTKDLSYEIYENSMIQIRHLESFARVGPFRFRDQRESTRLVEVDKLTVGTAPQAGTTIEADWNLESGEVDWNVVDGEEDWGVDIQNFEVFSIKVIGTLDGETTYTETIPELIEDTPAANFYSVYPHANGIYHVIEIFTENVNDSFQLRTMELDGISAGLLT